MAECPFIDRKSEFDDDNMKVDHDLGNGETYRFYRHEGGLGDYSRHFCQFCQHIGRKYDVFECLNEWQWGQCSHLRANVDKLPDDVRAALPIQIYP